MLDPLEITHVFTPSECQAIIASMLPGDYRDAALVGGTQSLNTRRARIQWLDEERESAWVFRRLLDTIANANRRHFDFQLSHFAEKMQIALYEADPGGFFDWHSDIGDGPLAAQRKLTMVVQLSKADDYDGGTLETNADGVVRAASRLIGSALLLPSFVLHRVTPVTRAKRYSLTIWAHGPAFT